MFLSATPLERKYWPKELSNLRECRIQWPNALPVSVRSHWNGKPVDYMAALCRQLLDNQQEDMKQCNYHIFLNSVADISRIIKKASLAEADVRIVCSQSGLSKRRNEAKLEGFPIATTADPVKRINLYTSTAFEGQDIFDEHGIAFVVSDSHKEHTLVDISTELIQIAGRIRDSKWKNQIVQFYNTKPYPAVSADEFEQAMRRQMAEAEHDATRLNQLSDSCKASMKQTMVNEYIRFEGGKFLVDENRFNFEMMNYKVVNGIYLTKASMEAELGKNGISITDNQVCPTVSIYTPNGTGRSFKDLFEAYAQAVAARPKIAIEPTAEMIVIEVQDGLVKEAYEKLGVDEVRRMKYHKANIQRAVTAKGDAKTDVKIMELLKQSGIRQGGRYTKAEVKDAIQAAYDTLGLKRKAKSTDLKQWYEVKEESPKIDGKSTACMTITSPKVMRVTSL